MTFTEAAAEVLRLAGKPMHYKEITELAIEKNLLSHVGKSPEVTMGARLAALLKKEDKSVPIVRIKPGVFGLREWNDKKKKGKEKESEAPEADDAGTEVNALEVEAQARESHVDEQERDDDDDGEVSVLTGEDTLRADLAASGAELFDDEDDDDQPILAPPPQAGQAGQGAQGGQGGGQAQGGLAGAAAGEAGDGRRRRRRRRRGRGGSQGDLLLSDRASSPRLDGSTGGGNGGQGGGQSGGQIQPTAIISLDSDSSVDASRDPLAPPQRPMVRERQQIMAGGSPTGIDVPLGDGDELAGRDLADAALLVLNSFDRNAGAVPLRTLVDAFMRRGRLTGDPALATAQVSASLRADNLRRSAEGKRTRFRFSNGSRVALTDWILGGDLIRLEQDAFAAIDRYREGARRLIQRRVQELPGHAFGELALLALERAGMTNIKPVRRAGSPGGEGHFSAIHKTGTDEIRTAIVIRKDGREIGRERVTDLRGALHHYGPATAGWLVTTGQVLSGAREEAAAPGSAPVAIYDGLAFARLLEDYDVGVARTRITLALPDIELFETLRG
jgi:hypothetical protein